MTSIKICGISCPDMAREAVHAGANMIGLVFHPASPRYVTVDAAREIARVTRENGGIPVGIFVNHSADEMIEICEMTEIQTLQLHGDTARAQQHLLPDHYQRIYVQAVLENGELQHDASLHTLNPERDFILFDHCDPGSGKPFPWGTFHHDLPFRWLLAGGLNAANVVSAIQQLQPDGVDVSSGVERERGKKDIGLIRKFIDAVHEESLPPPGEGAQRAEGGI